MNLNEEAVQMHISSALKVIRMFDWLLDLYVVDFFVEEHWEKLPETWKIAFNNMELDELGAVLTGSMTKHVLPLSVLALMKTIQVLNLPRIPETCKKEVVSNNRINKSNDKLKKLFLKHVKLKKRHEISLMAEVVDGIAESSNCNAVIDFGSGLGHLVRMLSYKFGLYTAGIECQTQLSDEARKLDLELEYTAKKHLSEQESNKLHRPSHLNLILSSDEQLNRLGLYENFDTYGLVGLHPCGDLGPLLIRHFVNNKHVKYVCIAGCCFMKLTCGKEPYGYPMSDYVRKLDGKLSFISREISCHAIEVYCDRLAAGKYKDLKVHAFRAALEKILVEHDPALRHSPVRSIKHSDSMTFQRYFTMATERLDIDIPPKNIIQAESLVEQWRRVVTVYTLRLMLAPLVETVILLDRALFIMQHGGSCEIRATFDPRISPRNHLLIARR